MSEPLITNKKPATQSHFEYANYRDPLHSVDRIFSQMPKEIVEKIIEPRQISMMSRVSKATREKIKYDHIEAEVKVKVNLGPERIFEALTGAVNTLTIVKLNFSSLPIRQEYLPAFSRVVAHSSSLKYLDVRGCRIGSAGIQALAQSIQGNFPLSYLNLEGNSLDDEAGLHLERLLNHLPQITHLDLTRNRLEDAGATCIGRALTRCERLKYLSFRWNQIQVLGVEMLALAVNKLTALETFSIGLNYIEKDGVALLCTALKDLPVLKEVDFEMCAMGDEGLLMILEDLKQFKALKELNLAVNNLYDSIEELCETLVDFETLEKLNLSNNRIRIEDVRSLLSAMRQSPRLKSIVLNNNKEASELWGPYPAPRSHVQKKLTLTRSTRMDARGNLSTEHEDMDLAP